MVERNFWEKVQLWKKHKFFQNSLLLSKISTTKCKLITFSLTLESFYQNQTNPLTKSLELRLYKVSNFLNFRVAEHSSLVNFKNEKTDLLTYVKPYT